MRTPGGRKNRVYADLSQPEVDLQLTVFEPESGGRLDVFLATRLTWKSRTSVQHLIDEGGVLVNGAAARKPSQRLFKRDVVLVRVPKPLEPLRHGEIPIEVLYEDKYLLAINKPAGVVCHPVGKKRYNTIVNALHARYRNTEDAALDIVPRLCHRLDKDTSGVLLVALAHGVRTRMQWIFESKVVVKEYISVVEGLWERDYDEVDAPLARAEGGPIRIAMAVNPEDGLASRTIFCIEDRFPAEEGDDGFTLVRCSPVTGRQHQIRVHAASRGHPVFGDNMYGPHGLAWKGFPAAAPVIRRHALHARRIQFPHPITGDEIDLQAPLPQDMRDLIATLVLRKGDVSEKREENNATETRRHGGTHGD